MTRLAVLSDIHGNLHALDAVLADIESQPVAVDQVIVSGDMINIGPHSREVLERLTALGAVMIRGNHEMYLLNFRTPRELPQHRHFMLPPWLAPQLAGRWHTTLAALPDTISLQYPDAPPVRVIHGAPGDHWGNILPTMSDEEIAVLLEGVEEDTVIFGHTHLLGDWQVGRWHLLNPGSVGLPLDGQIGCASYLILDGDEQGWRATPHRAAFDVQAVLTELDRVHFEEQCGLLAILLMEELKSGRTHVVPYHRWHTEHHADEPISLERYREFLDNGLLWEYTSPHFQINP